MQEQISSQEQTSKQEKKIRVEIDCYKIDEELYHSYSFYFKTKIYEINFSLTDDCLYNIKHLENCLRQLKMGSKENIMKYAGGNSNSGFGIYNGQVLFENCVSGSGGDSSSSLKLSEDQSVLLLEEMIELYNNEFEKSKLEWTI